MKKREFDAALKSMCVNGTLDAGKMREADEGLRTRVVHHIVGKRGAIVLNLIPPSMDMSWLASCGYMYHERGRVFTFLCTSENRQGIIDSSRAPEPQPARIPFSVGKGQLVGYYPGEGDYGDGTGYAEGSIGHNPEAKEHFKKDAVAFLKAVQRELGYEAFTKKKTPDFNPGGIAVSGDASFTMGPVGSDEGIYITIDAGGHVFQNLQSRSGVTIMWRTATRKDPYGRGHNRFEAWNISAADFARKIRAALEGEYAKESAA